MTPNGARQPLLPIRIYRKLRGRFRRFAYARGMLDQQIPVQSINRTLLEYDVTFHGKPEAYLPGDHVVDRYRGFRMLALHTTAQAFPRPYFFHVADAILTDDDVIDPANHLRVFLELYTFVTIPKEGTSYYYDPNRRRRVARGVVNGSRDIGRAYIFSVMNGENYFHFVVDACARYLTLRGSGALDDDTVLLFRTMPNRWQGEYLELLDVRATPDNLLPAPGADPIRVGRLLVASPTRHRYLCSRAALDRLRSHMFDRLGLRARGGGRRLYVSRRGAGKRRPHNEAEVEECLVRHGFEILSIEAISVPDQIALFSEADTVVAPHGAGLTNIIYASEARIIELFPGDGWDLGYFIGLSTVLGHDHVPVLSTSRTHASDDFLGRHLKDRDFGVDIAALEQAVSRRSGG